jgi:hypothetical protein
MWVMVVFLAIGCASGTRLIFPNQWPIHLSTKSNAAGKGSSRWDDCSLDMVAFLARGCASGTRLFFPNQWLIHLFAKNLIHPEKGRPAGTDIPGVWLFF